MEVSQAIEQKDISGKIGSEIEIDNAEGIKSARGVVTDGKEAEIADGSGAGASDDKEKNGEESEEEVSATRAEKRAK
jgi:hypothetical protein